MNDEQFEYFMEYVRVIEVGVWELEKWDYENN